MPTSDIALSLLFGFILMLIVEQLVSPHSHSHSNDLGLPLHAVKDNEREQASTVEFDADAAELGAMEREQRVSRNGYMQVDQPGTVTLDEAEGRARAYPLTFGLIIHGLADGLALGVSSLAKSASGESSSNLSWIVFLALIIHKGGYSVGEKQA